MDVTDIIGPFGKIQIRIFILIILRPICWTLANTNYNLLVQARKFRCFDDDLYNSTDAHSPTRAFTSYDRQSQCYFNSSLTGEITKCTSWEYDTSDNKHTLVEEWDLVCDRAWLISVGYMANSIGNFLAYMPAGQLADKFGRRPMVLGGQAMVLLITVLIPMSNSMWMLLILKFIIGVVLGFAQNPFLCIFLESVGPQYRDYLMYSFSGAYGLGVVITSGIAWLINDWRILLWIGSLPAQLPLLLGIYWFLPESTRWLLTAKKYDEAEVQIVQHAKMNGITVIDSKGIVDALKQNIEEDKKADKASFLDVLRNRQLRKTAGILYAVFVFMVFINHGFYITIGTLGGSIYLNMALNGLSEVGVLALYHLVLKHLNRRFGLCMAFLLAGVNFLLVAPVPDDLHWLKITFAMTGKLAINLAYVMLYVFSAELFPTNVRGVAISGAMTAGRIGSILAPFADVLSNYYGKLLPVILYGILSLLTAGIFFLLPETRDLNLPDTVLQSERITRTKTTSKNMKEIPASDN